VASLVRDSIDRPAVPTVRWLKKQGKKAEAIIVGSREAIQGAINIQHACATTQKLRKEISRRKDQVVCCGVENVLGMR
jgi:hypothetical protein